MHTVRTFFIINLTLKVSGSVDMCYDKKKNLIQSGMFYL